MTKVILATSTNNKLISSHETECKCDPTKLKQECPIFNCVDGMPGMNTTFGFIKSMEMKLNVNIKDDSHDIGTKLIEVVRYACNNCKNKVRS